METKLAQPKTDSEGYRERGGNSRNIKESYSSDYERGTQKLGGNLEKCSFNKVQKFIEIDLSRWGGREVNRNWGIQNSG